MIWAVVLLGVTVVAAAATAWYYRREWKIAETSVAIHKAGMDVLRATVRAERSARRAAETARNEALRTRWAQRVEDAKKVTSEEDAAAAWDAAAARLRDH
jgi:hypothetical protein